MLRIRNVIFILFPLLLSAQILPDKRTESINFILYHSPLVDDETIRRIVDQLESDYRDFRHYFNLTIPGRAAVIIHKDQYSFQERSLAHRYEAGSVYRDEIHLQPLSQVRNRLPLSAALTQQVIRLILYSRRINGCPRWLYEGAAAYFAGIHRFHDSASHTTIRFPSDLDELLSHPHNEIEYTNTVYLAALSFKVILKRYGEAKVVTLLRLFNGEHEYTDAIPFSLGISVEQFERQWQDDLNQTFLENQKFRGQ